MKECHLANRWALIALVLLSLHCTKKVPEPVAAIEPEPVVEIAAEPDPVEAAIETSEALYQRGLTALETNRDDLARQYFDLALQELMTCESDAGAHSEDLQYHLMHLVEHIHQAEREFGGLFAEDNGYTASALDKLVDDTLVDLELREIDSNWSNLEQLGDQPVDYDVPIKTNRVVQSFIRAFSTDRGHIIGAGLERSTRYLPMMRKVFEEEGVPLDLCYLPLIESAYRNRAKSRASAIGLWQFIASTARIYKLRVNWWVDERMDPEAATRAAAKHLKDLHEEFGDWYLALCAYNAGPGRVRRAIRRGGSRDFWHMARRRLLPRETIGYIPAYLAGVTIAKNPEQHGFANLDYQQPLESDTLVVEEAVELDVLAKAMGLNTLELAYLNQHLIRGVSPDEETTRIRVPRGMKEAAEKALATLPPAQRVSWQRYTLERGDTLGKLAKRFGTTVHALTSLNAINNPRRLRVGQKLLIPKGSRRAYPLRVQEFDREERLEAKDVRYEVKRGDTLYLISKRFQTTIPSILSLNADLDPFAPEPGQSLSIHQGDRWDRQRKPPSRARGYTYYRVQRGDTLSEIAQRHRVGLSKLLRINGFNKRSTIRVGQRVKIPNRSGVSGRVVTYRIKAGDTLSKIAARYKVSVGKIMEWNRLKSQHKITVGQKLTLYL
ncbi:LysM peptidoglycan-binding domain-containing protein [Sulfidibacter corallicola]|uniref:LysM peptidoglycan-binding domain-containing protein n=1 Tax=Sulfidibacter corallicola TaxID=2818388 RepID=A0A8A4TPY7_SULCO|nr:LysM peptidoglycan-binding domain-containing protein [Sulfidibacter corallicola]QTD51254.1 LysM peptidoglycan-binding domain-containing protein [Sulfidibacter corallicola]